MKLVKWDTVKKGQSITLRGAWRDHMRTPYKMALVKEKADDYALTDIITMKDKAHLSALVCSFAEIAWAWGWRPKGLANTVAQVVQTYRLPE